MKVATYSRGKQLAIREEPGGEIIGTMGNMTAARVESVADGWVELTMGGYVREDLVSVYGLVDMTTYSIKQPETAPKEPQQEMDAVTPAEQPGETEAKEQPGETEAKEQPAEDSGELGSMKLNDLRELARNSGVKIPKNATKDKIIELLLSNE